MHQLSFTGREQRNCFLFFRYGPEPELMSFLLLGNSTAAFFFFFTLFFLPDCDERVALLISFTLSSARCHIYVISYTVIYIILLFGNVCVSVRSHR